MTKQTRNAIKTAYANKENEILERDGVMTTDEAFFNEDGSLVLLGADPNDPANAWMSELANVDLFTKGGKGGGGGKKETPLGDKTYQEWAELIHAQCGASPAGMSQAIWKEGQHFSLKMTNLDSTMKRLQRAFADEEKRGPLAISNNVEGMTVQWGARAAGLELAPGRVTPVAIVFVRVVKEKTAPAE